MRATVAFATGSLCALDHVLVRVWTEDGACGVAEAPARPMVYGETPQSIVAAIRDHLGPAAEGLDCFDTAKIEQRFRFLEQNPTAKAAVEIALFDLMGQVAGVPCVKLLGAWTDSIEVSHILGLGTPAKVAEQALTDQEKYGFKAFKLKAGLDPIGDTAMIREVRRAIGPDVHLTVDCNHGFDSVTAARVLPSWEEYDITWVEEPCPGTDRLGRARVARDTRLPLMADESAPNVPAVMEEIRRGDCRFISIKTARTGFVQSGRIRDLCGAAGLATVIGSQGDSDLGTYSSLHFGCSHPATANYPAELSFFMETDGGLLTEPPRVVDGRMSCPALPGLGVQIDEDKLARYRLDR
jgi:L-Ala-D/L-Glu epimerase / N-acetyl-D-glutamate racemase